MSITLTLLDDQIYCLQRTKLPEDLADLLTLADIDYVQGNDAAATDKVILIHAECLSRKISIYQPMNAPLVFA